ncbi:MAG: alkaline phosphatase [Pseudomonadota bacterium]
MKIVAAPVVAAALMISACSSLPGETGAGAALSDTKSKPQPPTPTGDAWFDAGQQALYARKAQSRPKGKARNVILFVGDGMDISTVTAARIFDGQSRGEPGEENVLSFETFPHVALAKTYTTDYQVADSAGTASAMVTGVKTRSGVLSIDASVRRSDCAAALSNAVTTIAERAERAGLATGVVSTAAITHATPAAAYAHSADRNWGADADMPDAARQAGCIDIARQLIEFDAGDGLDIALGGGRANFLPSAVQDPEYPETKGRRADNRNLTAEWIAKSTQHAYVWNRADFETIGADQKLLGLFEPSHMQFETDRPDDGAGEPSLAEMTRKAIAALSRDDDGFFLLVEAGRIDHAHHAGNAYRALKDTQAYAEAVQAARDLTSSEDTLIIVTADHGHTMTIQGYPKKNADILGLVVVGNETGAMPLPAPGDGKPYTTLSYANGPGALFSRGANLEDGRPAPTQDEATDKNYRQQSLIPTGSETHGGQDVPIYAVGPNAYLVSGVMEQNVIYHIMADALGLE